MYELIKAEYVNGTRVSNQVLLKQQHCEKPHKQKSSIILPQNFDSPAYSFNRMGKKSVSQKSILGDKMNYNDCRP